MTSESVKLSCMTGPEADIRVLRREAGSFVRDT